MLTTSSTRPLPLVALALAAALGCAGGGEPPPPAGPSGDVPDLQLAFLDGGTMRLSDYRGKVVLLDFWATWCTPCRAQEEILAELYPEVRGPGVEFLAVDSGEEPETVRSYVEDNPFPYPVVLDPEDSLGVALDVIALPTLVVVDAEGKIAYFQEGIADADELRRELERAGA